MQSHHNQDGKKESYSNIKNKEFFNNNMDLALIYQLANIILFSRIFIIANLQKSICTKLN